MPRALRPLVLLLGLTLCLAGERAQANLLNGLLVWHDFDDLVDGSGNGHDATVIGGTVADGIVALDEGDYVDIGTPQRFGPVNPLVDALSDFTIAVTYATTDSGSFSMSTASVILSIGPLSGSDASDFHLLTAGADAQMINMQDGPRLTSRQTGLGFHNGTMHLLVITYDAASNLFTFYHLDETGAAVAHGNTSASSWDGDWGDEWDETLDYGIRLGAILNSSVTTSDMGGMTGQFDQFAVWDRALTASEIALIPTFVPAPEAAKDPIPDEKATDVLRDARLAWTAGLAAVSHNVYFGRDPNGLEQVSSGQMGTGYAPPGLLNWGQRYYWRVDEVQGNGAVITGSLWSFTAEPYTYPLTLRSQIVDVTASSFDPGFDPNRTVDGSGLGPDGLLHDPNEDHMWRTIRNPEMPVWIEYAFDREYKLQSLEIWNYNGNREDKLGYGIKDLVIETSSNGVEYTARDPITLEWTATGAEPVAATTIPLDGLLATQVRLTAQSNFKTSRFGLSEVRMRYLPVRARDPKPASGSASVTPNAELQWRAGREADVHEVYFGSDRDSLALVATTTESRYQPDLLLNEHYYWRVQEVNESATPNRWLSDLWGFATLPYLVIDDMERYRDSADDPTIAIWGAWGDEFGGAEKGITHDDSRQSMSFAYDNQSSPLSEATFALPTGSQDWTQAGIRALTLYVYGQADNSGELYVTINNAPAQTMPSLDLTLEVWQEVNINLADFQINLQHVRDLTIGIEGAGSTGLILIDNVRLHPSRCVPATVPGDLTGDCIVDAVDLAVITNNWLSGPLAAEYTFDNDLSDSSGQQRHGIAGGSPRLQSGYLTLDGSSYVDVPLGAANPFDGSRGFSIALDLRTSDPGVLLSSARGNQSANHAMAFYLDRDLGEPFSAELIYENVDVGEVSVEDSQFFLDAGLWHRAVVTYDADSESITVYLDGISSESEQFNPAIPNVASDTVRIGATRNSGSPGLGGFIGDIDNVRIFNLTLTPEDIALLPRVPLMPGDINENGLVDQGDRNIVEANMGPLQLWP